MSYEVYKITNLINKKIYIGLTTIGYLNRFASHVAAAQEAKSNMIITSAIKKYGAKNFSIEVIEVCSTLDELVIREKYWIGFYRSRVRGIGYNITEGGECESVRERINTNGTAIRAWAT